MSGTARSPPRRPPRSRARERVRARGSRAAAVPTARAASRATARNGRARLEDGERPESELEHAEHEQEVERSGPQTATPRFPPVRRTGRRPPRGRPRPPRLRRARCPDASAGAARSPAPTSRRSSVCASVTTQCMTAARTGPIRTARTTAGRHGQADEHDRERRRRPAGRSARSAATPGDRGRSPQPRVRDAESSLHPGRCDAGDEVPLEQDEDHEDRHDRERRLPP